MSILAPTWPETDEKPAPLDLCPKCGRGQMSPKYIAAGGKWSQQRHTCSDRRLTDYQPIEGTCPEDEHLHERCTTCRYERVAWVAAP